MVGNISAMKCINIYKKKESPLKQLHHIVQSKTVDLKGTIVR